MGRPLSLLALAVLAFSLSLVGCPNPSAGGDPPTNGPSAPVHYLYATNGSTSNGTGGLLAYSISSNGVLTALAGSPYATGPAGGPFGEAISPNGKYLYVSNCGGGLSGYAIGSGGALAALSGSPFATGGGGCPETVTISPNGSYLYVTNNNSSNGVGGLSAFAIGSDGALTPLTGSPFATGKYPLGVAITPTGKYLYVANTASADGITSTLSAYSIGSDGVPAPLSGSPYVTGDVAAAVTISPNGSYLYVTNEGASNGTAGLSAFAIGSDGALTPLSGSPYTTGVYPYMAAISPNGSYLYVTNSGPNGTGSGLSAYSIGSNGVPTQLSSSPYVAGPPVEPSGVAFSPDGSYLFVTRVNSGGADGSVAAYSVATDGTLTQLSGSPYATVAVQCAVVF